MYSTRGKYIYVIVASDGRKKIGISRAPMQRLLQLEQSAGVDLDIMHYEYIDRKQIRQVESITHYILAAKRLKGEWFDVDAIVAVNAIQYAKRISQLCEDTSDGYAKIRYSPGFKTIVRDLVPETITEPEQQVDTETEVLLGRLK